MSSLVHWLKQGCHLQEKGHVSAEHVLWKSCRSSLSIQVSMHHFLVSSLAHICLKTLVFTKLCCISLNPRYVWGFQGHAHKTAAVRANWETVWVDNLCLLKRTPDLLLQNVKTWSHPIVNKIVQSQKSPISPILHTPSAALPAIVLIPVATEIASCLFFSLLLSLL